MLDRQTGGSLTVSTCVSMPTVQVTVSNTMQIAELCNFFHSSGHNHCQYSIFLPTEWWPGSYDMGGLVEYTHGTPCSRSPI